MALEERTAFATIDEALEDFRAGKFVVVVDAPDRENEGDLTIAAEFATPEAINFMATHGRGVICLCLTEQRIEELISGSSQASTNRVTEPPTRPRSTPARASRPASPRPTARTRSRSRSTPRRARDDLIEGGHMLPLRARPGGVLERMGQTEAAVDLATLAGLTPAGVVCEIMNDDGTMARVPDLVPYCEKHGLKMITVADLVEYRRRTEKLVERTAKVRLPTEYGDFTAIAYRERRPAARTSRSFTATSTGPGRAGAGPLRVPDGRRFPFPALRLRRAARSGAEADRLGGARRASVHGAGGPRIGLLNKLKAYELQEAASTRSRRTSSSASPPTRATTGSGTRSWPTSASRPSAF